MKRLFDIVFSILIIIVGLPVFACLFICVFFFVGKPVFFRQLRPGLNSVPFEMLKFRSMTDARDVNGKSLPDIERLSPFGRFLRSTSLDELPEIWNVLRGDMSFVGPRPLLMEYLPLYSHQQAVRHNVRPGITGWAQINGRNSLSWEEKFKLDVWYVEQRSFALDMKILWMTVRTVIAREGISSAGEATMTPFTGSVAGSGANGKSSS